MTIKLQSTANLSLSAGVKATIYGPSGVGKTRLIGSAPSPIILSAEKGLLSLRHLQLPYIEIGNLKDLTEAYTWLVSSKEAAQFKTAAVDSISEIAEIILIEEQKRNKNGQKAFGDAADSVIALYRSFRDLQGKHVVFIAKADVTVDGLNGAKFNGPALPGKKLPQAAPYFFDSVFQLNSFPADEKGYIPRYLRTQPDLNNQAKDRSGNLDQWENADPSTGGGLEVIFNKMLK